MINLIDYGFSADMLSDIRENSPGRVVAVHKERFICICEHGQCPAILKAGVYYSGKEEQFPTTGDFVTINYNPHGDSQIIETLARRSFFSRKEPGSVPREQAVAANFDYVFLLLSLNQNFNLKRLERYLTLAWQSGSIPVVILTKADLATDMEEYISMAENIAFGVNVHSVSAKTQYGLAALEQYLVPGKTIVFLGSSGVGKSSLLNALAGEDIMATTEIRMDDARGRHTTTHRQLVRLNSGAMIIDTPGMRELGMWDVDAGIGNAFADVEEFLGQCKFADCKHESEPGCAIKAAIENGELSQKRYESYLRLLREARYIDNKTATLAEKSKRHKEISKLFKQIKKSGGQRK